MDNEVLSADELSLTSQNCIKSESQYKHCNMSNGFGNEIPFTEKI